MVRKCVIETVQKFGLTFILLPEDGAENHSAVDAVFPAFGLKSEGWRVSPRSNRRQL